MTNTRYRYLTLRKRFIRNVVMNTLGICLALGGIGWVIHYFWRYTEYEITNDALVDQYIVPVNVRISGYIEEVRFIEHQQVRAGDTLLVLDDSEYRIKLADAEAALMEAEAAADILTSTIRTTRSNVEVSEANIAESRARLWEKEQDFKRYKNLLAEESVSRRDFEQVKAEYEAMQARYEALIRQKASSVSQADETAKRTKSAAAAILRKKADLEMARLNLSYTVVTAPYDGYMGRRTLEPGQLVQAGQSLTHIVRNDGKWVTANYKETQIARIAIGAEVNIKVDAVSGRVFKGRVTAISEATGSKYSLVPTDNSAGNFVKIQQRIPVRIDFTGMAPGDMQLLRAGMMVETEVKIRP